MNHGDNAHQVRNLRNILGFDKADLLSREKQTNQRYLETRYRSGHDDARYIEDLITSDLRRIFGNTLPL